jgi:hypothetical protein
VAIKRRVNASQGFRSFEGAWRTIQGYEAVHMIRKGKVRWLPKDDVRGFVFACEQGRENVIACRGGSDRSRESSRRIHYLYSRAFQGGAGSVADYARN